LKKVLLTGATGLLGINFYLINKAFKIKPLIHKKSIKLKNCDKVNLLNINKLKMIINNFKPNIILHTAALTNIDKCEKNKSLAHNLNVNVTKNLAEISKLYNSKLVFISTDQLYRKKKHYFSENENTSPLNYYAKTKKKAEEIIKKKLKNYLIIRTNFFGWGTKYRKSFSDIILQNLKKKKTLRLFDDVYFNPVNVVFLCNIIKNLILENKKGVFNVSSNLSISKYEFGLMIAKIFNFNIKLIKPIKLIDKKITKRSNFMSLSNKKLIKTLKISSNELSISKQIKDLKKHKLNILSTML
jgi:dTDP-4-dehydrorhamnose reductase